jgi:tetratricopeptide (TPR) repeat protein
MVGKGDKGKGIGRPADLETRLQAALGDAYRLEKELGGGGMSRVFLAEEIRLGRRVVVKVLPPEMAAGVSVERFEREIQLAAKLQHPHIVPLLTAGASGDLLFYIMPYIEGESLRAKLAREGELPVPEALRILRDVVDALSYAHGRQVVHRDIKPDNVLLSGKHALVTDFGVAKAVAESTGRQPLTSTGLALGTPLYMAPEQATADPHTDHRADIYAVGVLAYEMLSGQPPFTGPTAQAVLAAHLADEPEPVTRHRAAVPEALSQVIQRCLAKRAADRWQRADELLAQLDALVTPAGGTTPVGTQPVPVTGGPAAVVAADAAARAHPVRVAGLYVLATVGVLAIVYVLVRLVGLPDWVWYGAIGLSAVGLPIMLLTARHERRGALARASGRVELTPATGLQRYLTWRRALLGGGLAFGGLGVVSALFMALRLLGVGPFATLLSAGVLGQRDELVLADFANRTSDSTLGASITEALRIDLTRSPVVRLVEGNQVTATLRRMQRDPAASLGEAVAREVALRDGAKAVVTGEVAPLGAGYVLAARVVSAADSSTLLAERETAADAAALIPAVERLSKKLREHIGESLRSIRSGPPLEEVTTSSLAALRAYSEGSRLFDQGLQGQALQEFNQAVALDSSFGMAWRRIGVVLGNMGGGQEQRLDALRHAYALRDRMPPREAAHAVAFYDQGVLGDRQKTIDAYRRLLASWPEDFVALNNLGVMLGDEGRPGEAEQEVRRALAIAPENALANLNLVLDLVLQGKDPAADSALAAWGKRAPGNASRLRAAARLASDRGQYSLALQYVDSTIIPGLSTGVPGHIVRARILRTEGKVHEAAADEEQARDFIERQAAPAIGAEAYIGQTAEIAVSQSVLLGETDAALRRVEAALRRHPLDSLPPASRPYGWLVYFYVGVGRLDRAGALAAEYQRLVPPDVRAADGEGELGLARLALARGDAGAALAGLRRAQRTSGCAMCTNFEEGQAYEQLGQADSALSTYERFVTGRSLDFERRDLYLAPALRRLGELYEAQGDRAKALEYYGRFVEVWRNADPELQPEVRDVKQRVARLAGEAQR